MEFGCGQCLPCRINRARLWQTRLMLEASAHPHSVFVTLTYAPENEPEGRNLQKRDTQLFFKKLRKRDFAFRYFLVGEYGERTLRPHYHAILFGLSVFDSAAIERSWDMGFVQVSEFSEARAGYIVGYVTKKICAPTPKGLVPEFQTQSRSPPIGGAVVDDQLCKVVHSRAGAVLAGRSADVPNAVRVAGQLRPLGRTLVKRLREKSGYDSENLTAIRQENTRLRKWAERKTEGVPALEAKRESAAASVEARFRARGRTRYL